MKRAGQLAIILASLMLITIKCTGGVNPGQARDTHQAIALTVAVRPAQAAQQCLGVILEPSMWTAGSPHHPGDIIHGKLIMIGGQCPPRDGYLVLDLQMHGRFRWRTLASDTEPRVPHIQGQRKVIAVFPACPSGTHHFRLHIHGRGHRSDGKRTKASVYWPSTAGREITCP